MVDKPIKEIEIKVKIDSFQPIMIHIEEVLKNYERNMHRGNNIHKAFALFDDVDDLLPADAKYFREKIHDICGGAEIFVARVSLKIAGA